jgi:hypothetical protein
LIASRNAVGTASAMPPTNSAKQSFTVLLSFSNLGSIDFASKKQNQLGL